MKLYREQFTDLEWFNILTTIGENVPSEYCDIFDREGEISEDYSELFDIDMYECSISAELITTLRDTLEDKIVADAINGDTTVLAEILSLLSIEQVVSSI